MGRIITGFLLIALAGGMWSCSSSGPGVTVAPTPKVTDIPEPTDTPPPWPVAWGETVCIAVDSYLQAVDPLKSMGAALKTGDLETASDKAFVVGADMLTAEVALTTAPSWKPGAPFVAGLLKSTRTQEQAMDLLDDPPAKLTSTRIKKATTLMNTARAQFDAAMKLLDTLRAAYGFSC